MIKSPICLNIVSAIAISLFMSCQGKDSNTGGRGTHRGKVEASFHQAAQTYQVPVRILMAVAFNESGMSPKPITSAYGMQKEQIGTPLGETAFGVSMETLGLDPEEPASHTLNIQINAYAKWLREALDREYLKFHPNPTTVIEKYDWIKILSLLHRDGMETRRNVQTLFALELMEKLNNGDKWQDPETGEILLLSKESPSLRIEDFPEEIRENLKIFSHDGDIFYAEYFELTYQATNDRLNTPTHFRIIHCPLTLSACLEMQNADSTQENLKLNAHYIIPPLKRKTESENNLAPFFKALQVSQHQSAVLLTNQSGEIELVKDAIVIMLVGNSGRYDQGIRTNANPKWFTKPQLEMMGKVIHSVCSLLVQNNDPGINIEDCQAPGKTGGVRFSLQNAYQGYQWGNIPDFDHSIFETYIRSPEKLEGEALFSFHNPDKIYAAGQTIAFDITFIKGANRVVIEYLGRCPDSKLVWSIKNSDSVRNSNSERYQFKLYQKGPNHNGKHFLRALIYKNKDLTGWAIDDFFITRYESNDTVLADTRDCKVRGT